MVQFDGLRPARLKVGIISAGRVGTALGVALERVDHVVVGCSAVSRASRQRAERWLPDTPVLPAPDVAGNAELLLLAVPDTELAALVSGLATTSAVRPGTIVAHTSGANGVHVLAPLSEQDCIPLAIHPAMTFTGADEDIARLPDTCFGITAADEVGYAIAQSLALENTLRRGQAALTGPVARGDAGAVAGHLEALGAVDAQLAQAYRVNALRTAERVHAPEDVLEVLAR
jgi:predicted short-subunit dehydrogenase-like oxidoreductase (DUF2520 family)